MQDGKEILMSDLKKTHFSELEIWGNYDVVIYTGVITAGVNFDFDHFDRFIAIYEGSSSPDLFIQSLLRV